MFIITYTSGSWDDFERGTIFVTEDEELAKRYCEKANSILPKVKEFFQKIDDEMELIIYGDEGEPSDRICNSLWFKYRKLADVNLVSYEQIEVR